MSKRQKRTLDDIPTLPGYVTVAQVTEKYGLHKGSIYYMIYDSQAIKTVFKVTKGGDDKRPVLLLLEAEVDKVMREREQRKGIDTQEVAAWNQRVKDWGTKVGWTQTPVRSSGPPHMALAKAYLEASPEDARPV